MSRVSRAPGSIVIHKRDIDERLQSLDDERYRSRARLGMLMRHASLDPGAAPEAVVALPVAVVEPALLAPLVPPAGGADALSMGGGGAGGRAVPAAPVTTATDQKLPVATGATAPDELVHASAVASAMDSAGRA